MKNKDLIIIFILLVAATSSCNYDSEEELYPGNENCDTIDITYSAYIKPVLSANCFSCHSNANAPSSGENIHLEDYDDVKTYVNNGHLFGAINHKAGYEPMPRNAPKLDKCTIANIGSWINDGAPDN